MINQIEIEKRYTFTGRNSRLKYTTIAQTLTEAFNTLKMIAYDDIDVDIDSMIGDYDFDVDSLTENEIAERQLIAEFAMM